MSGQAPEFVAEIRSTLLAALPDYDFGLRVLNHSPESSGNYVVELTSRQAILTVTRDRGQVFVDVASPEAPTEKYWLGELIAFADGESRPRAITDMRTAAAELRANHSRVFARDLLVVRSQELKEYRRAFNQERWGR